MASTVVWAALLAGPIAAIAVVQVPEAWRGPWLPAGVALMAIAFVALLRWVGAPSRPRFGPEPGDRDDP